MIQPRWIVKRDAAVVGAIVFILIALFNRFRPTAYDNYTLLADAFVHGRLWIDSTATYLSAVPWHGHRYVIEPVWPGVLMLPLAFVFHERANQAILSAILVASGSAACWSMLRRIGLTLTEAAFTLAIMLFATSYFYGGSVGDVWQTASVSAVTFTFLLMNEVVSKNRPWLVAVYAAGAALSRYTLLPSLLAFAVMAQLEFGWRYTRTYCLTVLPFLLAYAGYNYARWGTIADQGYRLYETELVRVDRPMFAFSYIPMQLRSMFQAPPTLVAGFPWIVPDQFGIGMFFTGSVFAGALLASLRKRATIALWILTLLAVVPNVLYYDNGDAQFGFRHEMDFAPYLLALLAIGIKAHRSRIVYAVGTLNALFGVLEMSVYKAIYP